jgi:hypothetical protein
VAFKTKTVDRSIGTQPTKWDTYQKNVSGQYVYLASGTGNSRALRYDVLQRNWYTFPGWKTFRANNGYLPTQNMTETREYADHSGLALFTYFCYGGTYRVDMKTKDPIYTPRLSGTIGFKPHWHSSAELTALRNEAKQKCLSRARDMKVNVSVMLGEGRQTVRMLADTARTLGRAYRNFRRGRFRQAAKELGISEPSKGSANHWLAYNYGWMPLLADAKGLISLAEKGLTDPARGPRFKVTGKATSQIPNWKTTTLGQGSAVLPGGETVQQGSTDCVARAGLLLEFTSSYSGMQSLGLGVYDPLLTAWELTPFSFVFDWFISVGDYLENLSTLQGVTVLAGFESHKERVEGSVTMLKPESNGWIVGELPKSKFLWQSYLRENWLGSVPLRKPLFDGLNARRLITSAALWRQRTRGDREFGKYRP